MTHHIGSRLLRWFHMAQDGPKEASKMAQDASKTAQVIPETHPERRREAKNVQKLLFFYDFTIRRYCATGAPKGPKMAPRQPKMGLGGSQDSPRWPKDGPKRASGKLKWAQEGPKKAPRWPKWAPRETPRALQEGTPTQLGSGTPPGPPWDPSGTLPGPLQSRFWNRFGQHFVIFRLTQVAPKRAQNDSPHGLDTAVAPTLFVPHRPDLSKFGERPVTSPQASSIRHRALARSGVPQGSRLFQFSYCSIRYHLQL